MLNTTSVTIDINLRRNHCYRAHNIDIYSRCSEDETVSHKITYRIFQSQFRPAIAAVTQFNFIHRARSMNVGLALFPLFVSINFNRNLCVRAAYNFWRNSSQRKQLQKLHLLNVTAMSNDFYHFHPIHIFCTVSIRLRLRLCMRSFHTSMYSIIEHRQRLHSHIISKCEAKDVMYSDRLCCTRHPATKWKLQRQKGIEHGSLARDDSLNI